MSNAMNRSQRPKVGDILVNEGIIEQRQLTAALAKQRQWGSRIGLTLVRLGFVTEEVLIRTLARQLGLAIVRLEGRRVAPEILDLVPSRIAEKHRCLPLFLKEDGGSRVLQMAIDDPADLEGLDELSFALGIEVQPVLVAPSDLEDALRRHYKGYSLASDTPADSPASIETRAFEGDGEHEEDELTFMDPVANAREPGAAGAVPPAVVLRALTQLLVEKGVLDRDELVARLKLLSSKGTDGAL